MESANEKSTRPVLQSFVDEKFMKMDFPAHIVIIGKTMSGKSHLAGKIINSVEKIFTTSGSLKFLVVLSPHERLEESLTDRLDSGWTIIHFPVQKFNQEIIDRMMDYLSSTGILGGEIIVLIDDLAVQVNSSTNASLFLVKTFALLRHQNIALLMTVQNTSPVIMDVIQNCTIVLIMQSFGSFSTLTKIVRVFVGLAHVPSLLRKIYPLLEENHKGGYITVNLSHEADKNKQFTLTNDIMSRVGFTKQYLQMISLQC